MTEFKNEPTVATAGLPSSASRGSRLACGTINTGATNEHCWTSQPWHPSHRRRHPTAERLQYLLLAALLLGGTSGRAFAAVPDALAGAQWIWTQYQRQTGAPPRTNFFRTAFQVEQPGAATLAITSDESYVLYLNGEQIGSGDDWRTVEVWDIGHHVRPGRNVLAVEGSNSDYSAAGLAVRVQIEQQGREPLVHVSNPSWKIAYNPEPGWSQPDFNDARWGRAMLLGPVGPTEPWREGMKATELRQPRPRIAATAAESLSVPEGFQVELLYAVPKREQDSWIAMTDDPQGRLICAAENGKFYRVTVGKNADDIQVEPLDLPIGPAQGLLYAYDSLYVVRNDYDTNLNGLYRARDTDGDGQFEDIKLLKQFQGSGGHGAHAIRLGPDGLLYLIAGNEVKPPKGLAETSPHKNWAEDLLLKRNPDGTGHGTGRMAPGGWIARTDPNGERWELFCGGLRNAYDFAFNAEDEIITFDSDLEYDTGTPWYRPTRFLHITSAAEFGWRYGTGKWPDYYADSRGAIANVGLASPTGVEFGYAANFPPRYRRALFAADWTYGRIFALHLTPAGASYTGKFETFVSGRPLPVVDLLVRPQDGALYFILGGRHTQSGLYRVTYVGSESTAPQPPPADPEATAARHLRRELEQFHGRHDARAVDLAWPHLSSPDRAIRYAARVAIEHQPLAAWQQRALDEREPKAAIQAAIALARSAEARLQADVLEVLNRLPWEALSEEEQLDLLRAYQLVFIRLGGKSSATAERVTERLSPRFPTSSRLVSRELCQLLVYLEAPGIIARAMEQLETAATQEDQLFYVFVLRNLSRGWSLAERRAYFVWLNLATRRYQGGASFLLFLDQIRKETVATLSADERQQLGSLIQPPQPAEASLQAPRQVVRNWQMQELVPLLPAVEHGRSFERGQQAFVAAGCQKCHRFAGQGGATGPDLTGAGNRFTPLYLIEAMIQPSQVIAEQYRSHLLITTDGRALTGRIIEQNDQQIKVRTDPLHETIVTVPRGEIEELRPSPISEMPSGLLNVLTQEEILDLVAYLRSAGNPQDAAFGK